METSGIIFIACGGIFVLTIILVGCLGKMKEKRTVTNEPINQKSIDVTSGAGGFTFYPAAASLPSVSTSVHQGWKMKETVTNGPAKKPDNQKSTTHVTSNGIGGGLMFLSAASLTASVSSNRGCGGGTGHQGYGGGGGHHSGGGGGGHHDGGGCGGGCGGG